ncbi:MAG: cytochrome c3 family protein [Firmicutes bacterium]|nr:cytochrome c3 family protein [Bacillota bacterium]
MLIFAVSINNPSFNYLSAKEAKTEICPRKESCLTCHKKITADVVKEWKQSKHGMKGISCSACHSNQAKNNSTDPDSCKKCHKEIEEKFKYGKHGFTMLAAKNMFKTPPHKEEIEGNCGTCHSLYAEGKCQRCHTEHKFEIPDTENGESCLRCHKEPVSRIDSGMKAISFMDATVKF